MNKATFREPNFKATVTDRDNRQLSELHFSDTAASLSVLLTRRVNEGFIDAFQNIQPYDFADWKLRAQTESDRCMAARKKGEAYEWDSSIWTELKGHLLTLFHGKCAYCETKIVADSFADVEHYRPKSKVTDEKKAVVTAADGSEHPGYYWTAYDYTNYLPACSKCNGSRGKLNKFPVKGTRAFKPTDPLAPEDPALINPLFEDPAEYLLFVPSIDSGGNAPKEVGTVTGTGAKRERGDMTREIVWLNREDLIDLRRQAQQAVRAEFKVAFANEDRARMVQIVRDCVGGVRPFSAAALSELMSLMTKMGLPLPTN
jgi:hypothetical protein